jgi:hypothetical protein
LCVGLQFLHTGEDGETTGTAFQCAWDTEWLSVGTQGGNEGCKRWAVPVPFSFSCYFISHSHSHHTHSHSSCHAFPVVLRENVAKKDEHCRFAMSFWPHWLRPPWYNNEPTNMGTCRNQSVAHVPTHAPLCSGVEATNAAREECNDRERAKYNERQRDFDKSRFGSGRWAVSVSEFTY